jgi:hypothetical protein
MLEDFRRFMWFVWTKVLGLPAPTRLQYDIAVWLMTGPRRRMIQAFRGVGKSYITAAYIVWRLWRNRDEKILVVSANEEYAKEVAGFIRKILYGCPFLSDLRPKGGDVDNMLAFNVAGCTVSKSPSVKIAGITGQITGSRATIVLFDDVEVPKNSQTEIMRERLEKLTGEAADVAIPKTGEIIYLGTPQSIQSIYRKLPSKGYVIRIWPARYPKLADMEKYAGQLAPILLEDLKADPTLHHTVPGGLDIGGAPTDPKRFNHDDLVEREIEKGRSEATLQYMLDTRLADEDRYPLKVRNAIVMDVDPLVAPSRVVWGSGPDQRINNLENPGLDGDAWYRPMFVGEGFVPYTGSVMFIDPSGRGADRTAYCVTKMLNGTVFVRRWGGLPEGYSPETLQFLADVAKQEDVAKVMVEENYGSGMFTSLLTPYLVKTHPCQLEEFRVSGQKELRMIGRLEPALEQHRLVFDRKLVEQDLKGDLGVHSGFFQLTRLTRDKGSLRHDDLIDCLAEAVGHWQDHLKVDQDKQASRMRDAAMNKEIREMRKKQGLPIRGGTGRTLLSSKRR